MKTAVLPVKPTQDMLNAAFMLVETMPKGTDARHMRIAAKIWEAMVECAPEPNRKTGLTPRMLRALEIITAHIDEHGEPPRYEDIGAIMGKGKSQIHSIMKALRRRGFITYADRAKRSMRVLIRPGETKP